MVETNLIQICKINLMCYQSIKVVGKTKYIVSWDCFFFVVVFFPQEGYLESFLCFHKISCLRS